MRTPLLLVDDDPAVASALGNLLATEGYDVVCAHDGRAALDALAAHGRPELVLLDLCMPGMGGWDTFERLTAFDPSLPVVVITARPDQQPLAAVAGVDAVLEKPLNVARLLETIRMLLVEEPAARRARLGAQAHSAARPRSKNRKARKT